MTEPRTEAGRQWLATPAGRVVTGMREAILAIEAEAALPVPALDAAQVTVAAVVDWITRQQNTPWAESWSQDFRNGYDAALEEVDAIVSYRAALRDEGETP